MNIVPIFTLAQDGKVYFQGTENSCYMKLQRLQGQSADHAIKHGGWAVTPYACMKDEAELILKSDPYREVEVVLLEDVRGYLNHTVKCALDGVEMRASTQAMCPSIGAKAGQVVKVMQNYIYEPYKP